MASSPKTKDFVYLVPKNHLYDPANAVLDISVIGLSVFRLAYMYMYMYMYGT